MADDATRALFHLDPDITYLNCAAVGPRLRAVTAAGVDALERYATPWLLGSEDWFGAPERLRGLVGELVGVPGDAIAFVPSVSYGMAAAVLNLPVRAGSNIVVLDAEFPSAWYAWSTRAREVGARMRVAIRDPKASLTEQVLSCIDQDTAVVAVPACHWTDGRVLDLVAIGAAVRAHGGALVVDASQALGAMPLDLAAIAPDLLVAVGYKWMLGAYGFGYAYVSPQLQGGRSVEQSWLAREGSEDFTRLVQYTDAIRPGARRHDSGEMSQFISVAMSIAAVSQLTAWTVPAIAARLAVLTDAVRTVAAAHGFRAPAAGEAAPHLIGLERDAPLPIDAAARFRAARVHVSVRGACIRVAPHLHSTSEDVQRLGAVLATL